MSPPSSFLPFWVQFGDFFGDPPPRGTGCARWLVWVFAFVGVISKHRERKCPPPATGLEGVKGGCTLKIPRQAGVPPLERREKWGEPHFKKGEEIPPWTWSPERNFVGGEVLEDEVWGQLPPTFICLPRGALSHFSHFQPPL